jgi:hypothetical protein
MTRKDVSSLAIVVLIGLLLQVGLVFLDCTNSPSETAVRYARAYYNLSPSMAEWLCDGTSETSCKNRPTDSAGAVAMDHIYSTAAEAAERGFGKGYEKYTLSHIETRTDYIDDTTAVVHLTAHRRRAINPLYVWVARLFKIGEVHEVDASIHVKLEGGNWRVCRSSSQLETG